MRMLRGLCPSSALRHPLSMKSMIKISNSRFMKFCVKRHTLFENERYCVVMGNLSHHCCNIHEE